jgi:DNA-binding response OmpR family regulator
VIRQLRTSDVAAPVLMFSAMKEGFYETSALNAGADDFLLKTASIPSLISRIRATSAGTNRDWARGQNRRRSLFDADSRGRRSRARPFFRPIRKLDCSLARRARWIMEASGVPINKSR